MIQIFIKEIVKKIYQPVTLEFQQKFNEINLLPMENVYKNTLSIIDNHIAGKSANKWINMRSLATNGCPHSIKNKVFEGCSFCDYHSSGTYFLALMTVLREKDLSLYKKAVLHSYEKSLEKIPLSKCVEFISAYDSFNEDELPNNGFLNRENNKEKNILFYFVETRASSITNEKLAIWKNKIGKHKVIEFGVEVGNEWIRNHWLNKNILDEDIFLSYIKIKKNNLLVCSDILLGIPGYTDKQSLEIFKATYKLLMQKKSDFILCSPLFPKGYTLQNYIRNELKDNKECKNIGIVTGTWTGMPHIYMILEAFYWVVINFPESADKLLLSTVHFPPYMEEVYKMNGNNTEHFKLIERALLDYKLNKVSVLEMREKICKTSSYKRYLEDYEKQKSLEDLPLTMLTLGIELAKKLYGDRWKVMVKDFEIELQSLLI